MKVIGPDEAIFRIYLCSEVLLCALNLGTAICLLTPPLLYGSASKLGDNIDSDVSTSKMVTFLLG